MRKRRAEREQVKFVFEYFRSLLGPMKYGSVIPYLSTSLMYDDSSAFVYAFVDKFPSRSDPTCKKAAVRLRKRLKQMYEDGWLDKHRQVNQREYFGEAVYQDEYRPARWLIRHWENGKTVQESVDEYLGKED